MVDFQELGEHFPSDSSVLIFASTTRVGTWFGHAMSPYTSTCHFLVVPRVVFLFVDVSFFCSATSAFLVVTRGVNMVNFCSATGRLQVPT